MPNHIVRVVGVDTTRSGMIRVLISQVSPTPVSCLRPRLYALPRQYLLPQRPKQEPSAGNFLFDDVESDAGLPIGGVPAP